MKLFFIHFPVIPPLMINSEFLSTLKANYFKRFFNQPCTANFAGSSIPSSVILITKEIVTTIKFHEQLISKLIVALNPNRTYGHDGLSIRVCQIGSDSICKFLSIIFRNFLKATYFQAPWKKAIVFSVLKKRNKKTLNNYWYVSFLRICENFLKKSFLNTIFKNLVENNLLNPNLLGFMGVKSCIHQLT